MVTAFLPFQEPIRVGLADKEVHVWYVFLDQPPLALEHYLHTLSDDERRRAHRFHFERDRRRFMVARGMLRILLGTYTDIPPEEVSYRYGPHGKPCLAGADGEAPVRFNLSHSGETVAFALARDVEVGIDVERIRLLPDMEQVAAQVYCDEERAALGTLPSDDRIPEFFRFWTRKEAYIKACGLGLSAPLKQIDVSAGTVRLIPGWDFSHPHLQDASGWSMWDLAMPPAYAGAVVAEGTDLKLRCWRTAIL